MNKAEMKAIFSWANRFSKKLPYKQTATEMFPKHGVIAFTSNHRQATYELLKRPAEVFDFSLRDFSILENVDLKTRIKLIETGLDSLSSSIDTDLKNENQQIKDNSETTRKEIDNDESHKGIIFVSSFLKNTQEAEKLEKETLGLNLFINFRASQSDSQADHATRICQHCGNLELPGSKNGQICEVTASNCEIVEYNAEDAQKTQDNEVSDFYKRRGTSIDFNFDVAEDIDSTRVRLVQAILQHFKY